MLRHLLQLQSAALDMLRGTWREMFIASAVELQALLPSTNITGFPSLSVASSDNPSTADQMAASLLAGGHGSLWAAVRKVVAELHFQREHRTHSPKPV